MRAGRAEAAEEVHGARERRRVGRLEPLEGGEVALSPGEELERRAGEVDAGDLRRLTVRKRLPGRPEAQGEPRPLPPGTAGALIGRGAADAAELQPVEAGRRVVAQAPHEAGVDDRRDPFDRDRGLGDVGGEHDLAARQRPEHGVLALGREVAVERQHRDPALDGERRQGLGRALDLADAGQEDEHVAGRLVERAAHAGRHDGLERPFVRPLEVADLDGVEPAAALDDPAAEIRRDRAGVERRGHGEQPQVRPHLALDAAGHGERQVGVDAALVELVEDDRADVLQERIGLEHLDEDALGDDQQAGRRSGPAVEAHVVADLAADRPAALLRDAPGGGAGGDPPRLEHDDSALAREPGVEQRRRHARGLAGAGGRHEHRRRRGPHGDDDLGEDLVDRQRLEGSCGAHGRAPYRSTAFGPSTVTGNEAPRCEVVETL